MFALVVFGPRTIPRRPVWTSPYSSLGSVVGAILLPAGAALIIAGALTLWPSLSALPYPVEKTTLLANGPYRIVRHPMYASAIFMGFGWAL